MKSVHLFSNFEAMAEKIALEWQDRACQAEKEGDIFSVVLSGGNTASNIYSRLANKNFADKVPWHLVHFFWADERCVPPESDQSNFGNCQRFLLNYLTIPNKNIHRIRGEEDPTVESYRYAQEVQDHVLLRKNQNTFFDWVFLGVGVDGHTASLFPEQSSLMNSQNLCEEVTHPQTGQTRITLTPLAIKSSSRVIYHVVGGVKARVISTLLSKSKEKDSYPAAHIRGEWYLDQAAASYLKNP